MCDTSDNRREKQTLIAENTLLAKKQIHENTQFGRPRGKSRRMRLLERMGFFGDLPPGVRITRATTPQELENAYQMVHDGFVDLGYIKPMPFGLRIRMFEAMPETATFIARKSGNIVGVTSVAIDSPELGLPSDEAFHKEINKLRRPGRKICEGTNWYIDPDFRKTSIMTDLMRCCFAHAVAEGCTDMIADLTPTHKSFYELMAFDIIGSERNSSQDLDVKDPVVLVNLAITETVETVSPLKTEDDFDLAYVKVFYIDDNPYRKMVKKWKEEAETAFLDSDFLEYLFVDKSFFLERCDPEELEIICNRWGEELFQEVMGIPLHNEQTFELSPCTNVTTEKNLLQRSA